jgi:predicted NAD/FAD-binding protein
VLSARERVVAEGGHAVRIAIVGSGISGLVCAHLLRRDHDVTLFEADARPGGHTNTVRVELPGETHDVDTGFIVFNEKNYPAFTRLLDQLGVATHPSDMSFSVSDERIGLEWCGTSARTMFAQHRNLTRHAFHRMLVDVVRFNRVARRLLDEPDDSSTTLADLLATGRWSRGFVDWYLVPLGSAIWSADPETFLGFPASTFARFFDNHGLLQLGGRPQWRTVTGGAARYVDAIIAPLGGRVRLATPVEKITRRDSGVELLAAGTAPESFDHVIVATHSDQALDLLSDPTDAEREVLGAIGYQSNIATLHTDTRLLPRHRKAWASWNYHRLRHVTDRATVTYHLNRLQGLSSDHEICLTLNRPDAIDPQHVRATFRYAHPVFGTDAVRAQRHASVINGRAGTWFCGAYWGYGFHEDGVQSALRVCERFGARL